MGLLSDPLCSPGVGRKVPLVGSTNVVLARDEAEEGRGSFELAGVDAGNEWGENGGGWVNDDIKVAAALDKASVLLEDADMMRRMLEKLLEFDEKKYTAMFQVYLVVCQSAFCLCVCICVCARARVRAFLVFLCVHLCLCEPRGGVVGD